MNILLLLLTIFVIFYNLVYCAYNSLEKMV